jgi:hypothetical protein
VYLQLVTQAELEAMPEDPQQRFVAFEALCRSRLAENVRNEQEWANITDTRVVYMSTVIGAAKSLRIEPFASMNVPRRKDFADETFDEFIQDIQFYITQLMFIAAESNTRTSIVLGGSTRQRLQTLVAHIRENVGKLDLPPEKMDRLNARINAFESELTNPRLRILTVSLFAIGVIALVADVDGAGSAIGKLVHQIEEAVGKAKDVQDAEAAGRLKAEIEPPKLEAPRNEKPSAKRRQPVNEDFSRSDFDDEIPF